MKDAIEGGAKAAEAGVKTTSEGIKSASNAVNTASKTNEAISDASAAQKLPKAKTSNGLPENKADFDSTSLDTETSKLSRDPFKNTKKYSDNNLDDSAVDSLEKSKENRGNNQNKYSKTQKRLNDISDNIENSKDYSEEIDGSEGEQFAKNAAKNVGNAAKTVASDAVGSVADIAGIVGSAYTENVFGVVLSALSLVKRNIKYVVIALGTGLLAVIISLAFIVYFIYSPLLEAVEKLDKVLNMTTDELEKGNNFYTGFGYQSTKDAFYEEVEYLYNEYDQKLDIPLLMSTLFYTDMYNGYNSNYNINLIENDKGDLEELEASALKESIILYMETKYRDVYSTLDEDGKNYTIGKIYRLRKLARHQLDTSLFGSNLPTTTEEITLSDFLTRSKSRLSDDAYQYLQTIASTSNPFVNATNAIHDLYSIIKGDEICETTSICNPTENEIAFTNLIKEVVLSILSAASIRYSIQDGVFYVTVYKYEANEDNYKNYLKNYYIPKMPEFSDYLGNAEGDQREEIIDRIIEEIYSNVDDFAEMFGYNLYADSEGYSISCTGGVDVELANDEEHIGLPVKIPDGFNVSFEGDYAYGIRDGIMHNGLDINGVTTGSKDGDDVFAIADGEVISSEPSVNCNTRTDKTCTRTAGAWVRIKHSVTIDKNTYNFISVYMHLQANSGQPDVGTKVKKGDKIGKIGNTGDSSGAHLHFEFRVDDGSTYGTPVDPVNLFIKCVDSSELVGDTNEEKIWWYLLSRGYTKAGVAGIMGNWQQESGLLPNNVQNGMGYTDEDYTNGVNSGSISKDSFVHDSRGYGLAQWTYFSRKANLYSYKEEKKTGIDDLLMQLQFYSKEAEDYDGLNRMLTTVTDVEDATQNFHDIYEKAGVPNMPERKSYARDIYNRNKDKNKPEVSSGTGDIISSAKKIKNYIATNGYTYSNSGKKVVPSNDIKIVDCSSFVSWVLYDAGYTQFKGLQANSSEFNANSWGFQEVSKDSAKAGDILVYPGHVEIYAGKIDGVDKVYNAGDDIFIRQPGVTGCSGLNKTIKILRPSK